MKTVYCSPRNLEPWCLGVHHLLCWLFGGKVSLLTKVVELARFRHCGKRHSLGGQWCFLLHCGVLWESHHSDSLGHVPLWRSCRIHILMIDDFGDWCVDYRSSMVDTSITDLRRSTHRSSVFEGQHIHLRRSTHRSSKVDTSISEGRHIVTSIFESRRFDLRRSTAETSHLQFVVEYCPQLRS